MTQRSYEKEKPVVGIGKFIDYKNDFYQFSFTYPENWILNERNVVLSAGSQYLSSRNGYKIFVRGPLESETKTGNNALWVTIYPTKNNGGKFDSLNEIVDRQIIDNSFHNTRIITKKAEDILGNPACEVHISFDAPLPFDALNPKDIPSYEIWTTILHGNYFFIIDFFSIQRDYPEFHVVYLEAKKTFRFDD